MKRALESRKKRFVEYLKYDSIVARWLLGVCGVVLCEALRAIGKKEAGRRLAMYLHRNAVSKVSDVYAERLIKTLLKTGDGFRVTYVHGLSSTSRSRRFFENPESLIGRRMLVLRSPQNDEKGVLLVDYSFVFPLLAKKFDVEKIMRKYHVVLEPSWSGTCDDDVLALSAYGNIFVQTNEPRDMEFLRRSGASIVPVPIAANWWVDTRVFRPLEGTKKDAHVFVNASWARFKRHERIFEALAVLRRRGHVLRTLLAGYPIDCDRSEIQALAGQFGLSDQIEMFESVTQDEINNLLNRVYVNLVWSRREGSNRAIIEGLSAGIPGVLRAGFNYGFEYPYVSESTVLIANERSLPDVLLNVIGNYKNFNPRGWIQENMNPHMATEILDSHIAAYCRQKREKWTKGRLAVKVSPLHAMEYWDRGEREKFADDYEFLKAVKR